MFYIIITDIMYSVKDLDLAVLLSPRSFHDSSDDVNNLQSVSR